MAPPLVLFESAVGYALFEIKDAEEIGAEVDSVQVLIFRRFLVKC